MPHTDFSVNGALMRMDDVFPNRKELYTGRDFDLLKLSGLDRGPPELPAEPSQHLESP